MIEYPKVFNKEDQEKISNSDYFTFDFFDTLVMRTQESTKHFDVHGPILSRFRKYSELLYRVLQKYLSLPDFKLAWLNPFIDIDAEFNRDLQELAPIECMVRFVNELAAIKKVAVVSNTYYNNNQLQLMGEFIGLKNIQYFASSDYGLQKSRNLKSKLGFAPGIHFHCGDNPKEDAKFGADFFKLFDKYVFVKEFQNYIKGCKTEIINKSLELGQQDFWFNFGLTISGPAVMETANRLNAIYKSSGCTNLICLGRDGFLVNAYLTNNLGIDSQYLPYSRKLAASLEETKKIVASLHLSQECRPMLFDLGWSGRTSNILKKYLPEGSQIALAIKWPWSKAQVDYEIYSQGNRAGWIKFRKAPEVWELAFTAPFKSAESFEDVVNPRRLEPGSVNVRISEGALAFFREIPTSKNGSIKGIQNLVDNPSLKVVKEFSRVSYDYFGQKVPLISIDGTSVIFWTKAMRIMAKMNGLSALYAAKLTLKEWARRLKSLIR